MDLNYSEEGKKGQFTRTEKRSWVEGYGETSVFDAEIEHFIDAGELKGNYCVKFTSREGYAMVTAVPVNEFIFE
jgi:hypothetical protein